MRECLTLARNGVPWDVIMELDATERSGMCVAVGQLEGVEYDWKTGKWIRPNA